MEKLFINSKSEIRNRQSAIKGPSVSPWWTRRLAATGSLSESQPDVHWCSPKEREM